MMIIKFLEAGVDIKILMPDELIYLIDPGEVANAYVPLAVVRKDIGINPVDVDVKYSGPFGSINKLSNILR